MRLIEIKPKGRTNKDKFLYKFLDWYFRSNKKRIKELLKDKIERYFLYGDNPY